MFTITVKDKIVLTRKEHRCFACWRKFPPKTSMNYNVSISDDGLYDCYSCPTCQLLMVEYGEHLYNECEGVYDEQCVIEAMDYFGKQKSPEDLLESLRNGSQK